MPLYWLSFCDTTRPKGQQFLGVSIVEGCHLTNAFDEATRLKINPGGEMMGFEIEPHAIALAIRYRGRFFSDREQIESLFGPTASPEEIEDAGVRVCQHCNPAKSQ